MVQPGWYLDTPRTYEYTVADHEVDGLFVKEISAPPEDVAATKPLLFLHGGLHGWWTWRYWQPVFARCGWQTYALSLRGHTGSRAIDREELLSLKLADYAADVCAVIDWIGQPVILVAHSMGGFIAQQVALARQLDALVLVATGAGQFGAVRDDLPIENPFWVTPQQARALFLHAASDDEFNEFYSHLVPESPTVLNDYTRGGRMPTPDVGCPVLVMEAEHDREVVKQLACATADFYSAPLLRVQGVGHDVMLEPSAKQSALALNSWLMLNGSGILPDISIEKGTVSRKP